MAKTAGQIVREARAEAKKTGKSELSVIREKSEGEVKKSSGGKKSTTSTQTPTPQPTPTPSTQPTTQEGTISLKPISETKVKDEKTGLTKYTATYGMQYGPDYSGYDIKTKTEEAKIPVRRGSSGQPYVESTSQVAPLKIVPSQQPFAQAGVVGSQERQFDVFGGEVVNRGEVVELTGTREVTEFTPKPTPKPIITNISPMQGTYTEYKPLTFKERINKFKIETISPAMENIYSYYEYNKKNIKVSDTYNLLKWTINLPDRVISDTANIISPGSKTRFSSAVSRVIEEEKSKGEQSFVDIYSSEKNIDKASAVGKYLLSQGLVTTGELFYKPFIDKPFLTAVEYGAGFKLLKAMPTINILGKNVNTASVLIGGTIVASTALAPKGQRVITATRGIIALGEFAGISGGQQFNPIKYEKIKVTT